MAAGLLSDGSSNPIDSAIDGLILRVPHPTSTDVAAFLQPYTPDDRITVAQALIARGIDPSAVSNALGWLAASDHYAGISKSMIGGVLTIASAAASAFHGIRRNKGSLAWGGVWFFFGLMAPVFTPVVALAQGFAKPKGG